MTKRSPIVVVMGHIDHGKSTLLDYVRQANVAAGEAGGITQALGAYEAKGITFLDTPGHQAFIGMRESSALVADLAVLVVSAEDGVKPQTLEAAKIIHEAKLPFIVAINKIDKPNANIERAKQELAENNIFLEGYGGKIPMALISAKTGEGVPELLDLITLVAELENLTGDPTLPGAGFVIEANVDPRSGISATVVIKNGTLKRGDFVVAGQAIGKIKQLQNFLGVDQEQLSFSSPALITGWLTMPSSGSTLASFPTKEAATEYAAVARAKPAAIFADSVAMIAKAAGAIADLKAPTLEIPLMIKSSTQGGAEAARHEILKLASDQTAIKVLSASAGQINENDVKLASGAKKSVIIGFQAKASKPAKELAERLGVTIVEHEIIYKLIEWLEAEIKTCQPIVETQNISGQAKILKIFNRTKDKQVIGGVVDEGALKDRQNLKIMRRDSELGQGKIIELQQGRLPAKEVEAGKQFGAMIESKTTLAVGDVLVFYV